ncbi:MAG: 16S rRNA (guanine(527)-N(7))-methyltransferase RsmG [Malacoplasma sp.]
MTKIEFNLKMQKLMPPNKADEFCSKLEIYKEELQKWNKRFNLTRLDSEDKIYGDYFFNSLTPYLDINFFDGAKFLDIGSGSGIPGILIALFYEKSQVFILESNLKKCNFMSSIVSLLKIENIKIINDRAEIFAKHKQNIESFDYVTNRAFAHLKIFVEIGFPLLKINGYLISPKSQKYAIEIEESQWIFDTFGIDKIETKKIESFNMEIYNIILQKTKPCPSYFPREWREMIK